MYFTANTDLTQDPKIGYEASTQHFLCLTYLSHSPALEIFKNITKKLWMNNKYDQIYY